MLKGLFWNQWETHAPLLQIWFCFCRECRYYASQKDFTQNLAELVGKNLAGGASGAKTKLKLAKFL